MGVLQCNGGKLEKAEDFKCVFVVNRNRSALVRELLSNNSVFVGQVSAARLCFDLLYN